MTDPDSLPNLRQKIADLLAVNIEDVESDQDLFALGFHSLLAVQLIYEIECEHGVRLNVRDVFERPTVRQLERAVQRHLTEVSHE
jgi:acyl carrier protein